MKWKHRFLSDKSGSWHSCSIPVLNWEYIVEDIYPTNTYKAGVFYSKYDDNVAFISKTKYKSVDKAKEACQEHLETQISKILSLIGKQ